MKYKSKIPLKNDGKPQDVSEQEFAKGHTPTRAEIAAKKAEEKQFGNYDDLKPMLRRVGGTMISQTEVTHHSDPGFETYSGEEWRKMNEPQQKKSYNKRNNTYYSWH